MAYSKQSKRRFVQKAFWIRKDLAKRLEKIVAKRRKGEKKYSERVAFSLALRAHIESEEEALALRPAPRPSNS
jgi:hypothetical protein